jgi:tetratricopeptide (TPR) repeat protein
MLKNRRKNFAFFHYAAMLWVASCFCSLAAAQAASGTVEEDLTPARQALREGRWKDAEQFARKYLNDHTSSATAHYLLAYALFREDNPKDSLAEYTHAAQLQKPAAGDLRWVALDYVLLHDYVDADKWMSESLQWDPHDGEVWYEMGRIKYQENRFAESIAAFEKTLALMPKLVKAENNLGLAYEGLNRKEDAIQAYEQAIAWQADAAKKSEQPLLNLGILLSDEGKQSEALPLLVEAETIAPNDGKIHSTLGKLYLRQEKLNLAEQEFKQAAAIDPASAPIHFQLGQVFRKEGKTAEASSEFAKAAEIDGSSSSKVQ